MHNLPWLQFRARDERPVAMAQIQRPITGVVPVRAGVGAGVGAGARVGVVPVRVGAKFEFHYIATSTYIYIYISTYINRNRSFGALLIIFARRNGSLAAPRTERRTNAGTCRKNLVF